MNYKQIPKNINNVFGVLIRIKLQLNQRVRFYQHQKHIILIFSTYKY